MASSTCAQRVVLDDPGVGGCLLVLEPVAHARGRQSASIPQRLVRLAVERELVGHALQTVGRRRNAALVQVELADAELLLAQHFLNVAQHLLRLGANLLLGNWIRSWRHSSSARSACIGSRSAFSICLYCILQIFSCASAASSIVRIEQNEVLVLRFGLRHPVAAALAEPAIGDGELRLRQVLAGSKDQT